MYGRNRAGLFSTLLELTDCLIGLLCRKRACIHGDVTMDVDVDHGVDSITRSGVTSGSVPRSGEESLGFLSLGNYQKSS